MEGGRYGRGRKDKNRRDQSDWGDRLWERGGREESSTRDLISSYGLGELVGLVGGREARDAGRVGRDDGG